MGVLAAAVAVSVIVGLPPYAAAPAPGALPAGAVVRPLDRAIGIVEVELPRRHLAAELRRLRRAPGTRYVTRDVRGRLQADCAGLGTATSPLPPTWWRATVHATRSARAQGYAVGVVDSGADIERLGTHELPITGRDFTGSGGSAWTADRLGHGTAVAGLIAANRSDVGVSGIAPTADLVIARVARPGACAGAPLVSAMVRALAWLRTQAVQVVNVSASVKPSPALRDAVRALQLGGTLVVAAAGNRDEGATASGYPAALPHVLGVAALSGPRSVDPQSVHGALVDLAAPATGLGVVASSGLQAAPTTTTRGGTSFAAPLVSGAAALVWAKHPAWTADRVAEALRDSARKLGARRPNNATGFGILDVARSLTVQPPADPREPNDWVAAALAQQALVLTRPLTLHATVDAADDPVDAYCVQLSRGQRLTISWRSGLHGLRTMVVAPRPAGGLLDRPVARMQRAAVSGRAGSSGSLTVRASRSGDYLVVLAGERGGGAYTLSLRRG